MALHENLANIHEEYPLRHAADHRDRLRRLAWQYRQPGGKKSAIDQAKPGSWSLVEVCI